MLLLGRINLPSGYVPRSFPSLDVAARASGWGWHGVPRPCQVCRPVPCGKGARAHTGRVGFPGRARGPSGPSGTSQDSAAQRVPKGQSPPSGDAGSRRRQAGADGREPVRCTRLRSSDVVWTAGRKRGCPGHGCVCRGPRTWRRRAPLRLPYLMVSRFFKKSQETSAWPHKTLPLPQGSPSTPTPRSGDTKTTSSYRTSKEPCPLAEEPPPSGPAGGEPACAGDGSGEEAREAQV